MPLGPSVKCRIVVMDAKVMKRAVVVLLCLFVALPTTAWENVGIVSIMNI